MWKFVPSYTSDNLILSTPDRIHVDLAVSAPGEEGVSVSRPLKGHAPWDTRFRDFLVRKFIQDVLVLQVPDLDARVGGSTEPVVLRREAHGVDSAVGIQAVQMLSVVNIPQHSSAVLTTGTAERTIRRDGDGIEHTSMTSQVGFQAAVVQVPDLDEFIPTAGHNERVLGGWREAHAGHPIGVVLLGDRVLAFSESIPKLDGLVTRTGHDLTVIGRERDGVDVGSMSLELTDGRTGVQVPQTHGGVHGSRKGKLTVTGDNGVAHSLVVTVKATTSITGSSWIVRSQLPNDRGLVTRTGDNQVGLLVSGRDGCDPSSMTLERTTVRDLSHSVAK